MIATSLDVEGTAPTRPLRFPKAVRANSANETGQAESAGTLFGRGRTMLLMSKSLGEFTINDQRRFDGSVLLHRPGGGTMRDRLEGTFAFSEHLAPYVSGFVCRYPELFDEETDDAFECDAVRGKMNAIERCVRWRQGSVSVPRMCKCELGC